MSEIKPKNGICSRCGYGIPVRKKGNLCVECSKETKKPDLKQIASAPLSGAKTKSRTPKANRRKSRRTRG